jgi:hypothetical protein
MLNHIDDDPAYATGEKLRPCRCGAQAEFSVTTQPWGAKIWCTGTCRTIIHGGIDSEARKLWNAAMRPNKPPLPPLPSLVEAVDAAWEKFTDHGHVFSDDSKDYMRRLFRESLLSHLVGFSRVEPQKCEKCDEEMERVKACEHIAEGDEGWESLRDLCPSTAAVANLRDSYVEISETLAKMTQQPGSGDMGWMNRLAQVLYHDLGDEAIEKSYWVERCVQFIREHMPLSVPLIDDRERCAKVCESLITNRISFDVEECAYRNCAIEIRKLPRAQEGLRSIQAQIVFSRWGGDVLAVNTKPVQDDMALPCTVTWLDPPPAAEPPGDAEFDVSKFRAAMSVLTNPYLEKAEAAAVMIERLREKLKGKESGDAK